VPAPWLGNLQSDWESPAYRRFVEGLASNHQVIRYDRAGTGLSDRELPQRLSLEHDVAVLEQLIDHLELGPVSLLGVSSGGCLAVGLAARHPDAVAAIVFAGSYLDGTRLATPEVRESLVALIRANWGLGARMLTEIFVPDATREEREEWVRFQRDAADPDAAADIFEFVYAYDVRHLAGAVACPALVLHRRMDTAVNFELGR
jgi:pimeloyl-ACP methyl ester carboxylesterase